MKLTTFLIATAALIAAPTFASAQGSSSNAPGQQMKEDGSKPGTTGASGYAPGQQMQDKGSKPGTTGASGYAPGQQNKQDTTGSASGSSTSGSGSTSGSAATSSGSVDKK